MTGVRHLSMAGFLIIGIASPAAAMPDRLSGAEIKQWIDGNTVVEVWADIAYRQLFRPDGTTADDADDRARDEGRWWVTENRALLMVGRIGRDLLSGSARRWDFDLAHKGAVRA